MTASAPTARAINHFRRKVQVGAADECWPHAGARKPKGYVMVHLRDGQTGAHRLAWYLQHGEWPSDGLVVRHKCDNPPCCNPAHLELGTVADNNRDRDERGRHAGLRGEALTQARLTEAQVHAIRARLAVGESRQILAVEHGVSTSCIDLIANRKTWRHVA